MAVNPRSADKQAVQIFLCLALSAAPGIMEWLCKNCSPGGFGRFEWQPNKARPRAGQGKADRSGGSVRSRREGGPWPSTAAKRRLPAVAQFSGDYDHL